jgi:O-antigen/teichoic acid export membrane protein
VTGELTTSSAVDAHVVGSPSILRRVRRDLALLGVGTTGIVAAQLCFRSILIVALVPAAYGRLSLILSVYNTVWIIGASGLPSTVARYIALIAPADDSAIVRSAIRAGAWPTIVAAAVVATASGIMLNSPLAFLFAVIGLSSLVYSLLTMGILRGRGRIGATAMIMPVAGVSEAGLLATLWLSGLGVTPLSAFGIFCLGNVMGLIAGVTCIIRTAPRRVSNSRIPAEHPPDTVPSAHQLLGSSMWLGAATVGIAILPLVLRFAAVLDSYTVVAIIDVALVLLTIPQRMGAIIVAAVVPHAARALKKGEVGSTMSQWEYLVVIIPFVLAAIVVAFTPLIGWLFDFLGRPEYAKSAEYLALALLAGPARILYGLVEGILVAHGEGKFLAFNSLLVTAIASVAIVMAVVLGSTVVAFAVFVVACWAVYLCGLQRIRHLTPKT